MATEPSIPFSAGDWLIDRYNPGRPGQWTGRSRPAGPLTMLELAFPGASTNWRPLTVLEPMTQAQETLEERLLAGPYGRARDLQRVITYEKLKGTLHEVIYSMEAAQIDFYPYQFKPVMKFISAPTERLILADEVGLGKTIESALIWIELQARRQAKRLLVVCPNTLTQKWKAELRQKFLLDARVVRFEELRDEVERTREAGPSHAFTLIATYTGLRPPKDEIRLLDDPPGEGKQGTGKTEFLRDLLHSAFEYEPFDMVVFDEAHYMRNPATTTFHLGEALSAGAGAVLCVSATPVNNSNTDLHSLLRLVDGDLLENQALFEELLEANRPTVRAGNALERSPLAKDVLEEAIAGMGKSQFIRDTPLFKKFVESIATLDPRDKTALAKCQSLVEDLNLLARYVNRTRRVQVKEDRPVRDPHVLKVEYSSEEMQLYNMILHLVRERCRRDSRPFHVFQVLGLQLRAASCLPALAQEIRERRFGEPEELMQEAFGEEAMEDLFDGSIQEELSAEGLTRLLEYDFEKNDSKYRQLRKMLKEQIVDEKVVIFAFYRPTLSYLRRRLSEDGITLTLIHGGVPNEERWVELDRFRDPKGPRVLLSSEVGSEGIDLQFCRVVVNYDLPWNPMRVEQRIGRIDRVGQQAARLAIVNFKVRGTIEERLYERLHEKLARFTNTLGDLEAVIGREVQQLTVDLLSKDLTLEQEQERMEKTERVIENRLLTIQNLEESGDALLGLSDYLQRRIEEVRGKGRYMQPEELEDYVTDFFEREFRGCEVNHNTPVSGCLCIRLTPDAYASLSNFVQNDRSLSARPFRQKEFSISFRREVMQRLTATQKQKVHFTNHLCPLVRWITKVNQERAHAMYNVSAVLLEDSLLPPGTYCYRIERWKITGLSSRERLAYAVVSLPDGLGLGDGEAEDIVQRLLRQGKDWDYSSYDTQVLRRAYRKLDDDLSQRFDAAVTDFDAQNATALQIREQRVHGFFDRRIAQDQQRLRTLQLQSPESRVIRATEGRLRTAEENKQAKLNELRQRAHIDDMEQTPIAAGVFKVVSQA